MLNRNPSGPYGVSLTAVVRRGLVVLAVAAAMVGAVTGSAGASVRSCHAPSGLFNFGNHHQEYLGGLSVRNMACGGALTVMHRASLIGWPPHLRARGWSCSDLESGGGGATVRCVRSHPYQAFRVSIGT
jgi:hypothetical protein